MFVPLGSRVLGDKGAGFAVRILAIPGWGTWKE